MGPLRGPERRRRRHSEGSSEQIGLSITPSLSDASTRRIASSTSQHSSYKSQKTLLDLGDDVRDSLRESQTLGPRAGELMEFLEAVLQEECQRRPRILLETIRVAHLDKLLEDFAKKDHHPSPMPLQLQADISTAASLQKHWRERFRTAYFDTNQMRYRNLTLNGSLAEVTYDKNGVGPQRWKTNACQQLSDMEGNLQYEPGHWWLNLACAYRDGMVGSVLETPTNGRYGATTLPLMSGREELHWPGETVKYIRDSAHMSDMHISLISQVGSKIRILRGYRLQSPQAPRAGIRYDGWYTIQQYGQKRHAQSGLHRVTILLKREGGQRLPFQELAKIPRPSQLDEWQLYERYEGEMIKQAWGKREYTEWRMDKAEESQELDQ